MDCRANTLVLDLDTAVYSLQALKNASYDFTDRASILIEHVTAGKIRVRLKTADDGSSSPDSLERDFIRQVLDHQIRLDVGADYKAIREMIIAQAFEPIDNLEEVIDSLKP